MCCGHLPRSGVSASSGFRLVPPALILFTERYLFGSAPLGPSCKYVMRTHAQSQCALVCQSTCFSVGTSNTEDQP